MYKTMFDIVQEPEITVDVMLRSLSPDEVIAAKESNIDLRAL